MPALVEQLLLVADRARIADSSRSIADEVHLSAEQRELVLAEEIELCNQIESLASALPAAEDEPELYRSLAALWLELRFQWQRHNLVVNYDTVLKGGCSPLVVMRASAASRMLERIEQLLAEDHREKLSDAAVEVLDRLRDDVSIARGRA